MLLRCQGQGKPSLAWLVSTVAPPPPQSVPPAPVSPSCLAPGNPGCFPFAFPAWPGVGAGQEGQPCPPHSPSVRPATLPLPCRAPGPPAGCGRDLGPLSGRGRRGNGAGPVLALGRLPRTSATGCLT